MSSNINLSIRTICSVGIGTTTPVAKTSMGPIPQSFLIRFANVSDYIEILQSYIEIILIKPYFINWTFSISSLVTLKNSLCKLNELLLSVFLGA